MPQVFTASWFAKLPEFATPVGISRGTPRRLGGYRRLRQLEPGKWFRSVAQNYLDPYSEILNRLDPSEIYDRLIAFGDAPVMLCWETASDCHLGKTFCHRHLAARWLEDRLGVEVNIPSWTDLRFMKKLIIALALAFAAIAGTAAVMTMHPQHAVADPNCSGC